MLCYRIIDENSSFDVVDMIMTCLRFLGYFLSVSLHFTTSFAVYVRTHSHMT